MWWIDSLRPSARPAGRRWRSKTPILSFCRTLSRFLIRPITIKENALNLRQGRFLLYGGEEGIRTLDTFSRIHTFQACSFSLSDTSPWSRRIA